MRVPTIEQWTWRSRDVVRLCRMKIFVHGLWVDGRPLYLINDIDRLNSTSDRFMTKGHSCFGLTT